MALTTTAFKGAYPEFGDRHPSSITHALAIAARVAGRQGELAEGACAAHMLAVSEKQFRNQTEGTADGGGGTIAEEWAGQNRIRLETLATGSPPSRGNAFWSQSIYGRTYIILSRTSAASLPRVV